MSSEHLASAQTELKGDLGASWNILDGASANYTDLGVARRFGGASAAYSLRDIGAMNGSVVRVRREPNDTTAGIDDEERFSANQVQDGTLERWVNGELESTLPADVATAAAAYSLRKVKASYSGDAVRIRRIDNTEVDVAFDSDGKVSTSSSITNVVSGDVDNTTETTLSNFLQGEADVRALFNNASYNPTNTDNNGWSPSSDLDLGSGVASWSCDFVLTGEFGSTTSRLFQNSAGTILFYWESSTRLRYQINSEGTTPIDSTVTIQKGRKYNMEWSRDASDNTTLKIDGVVVGTNTTTARNTGQVTVGRLAGFRLQGVALNWNFNNGQHIYAGDGVEASNWVDTGTGGSDLSKQGSPVLFTGQGMDSFVDIWYDQAGSNNAVQETAASQPKIAENGALLDGIKFNAATDGTSPDFLQVATRLGVTTDHMVSVVFNGYQTDSSAFGSFLNTRNGNAGFQYGIASTDKVQAFYYAGAGNNANSSSDFVLSNNSAKRLVTFDKDGDTLTGFGNSATNGISISNALNTPSTTVTNIGVGGNVGTTTSLGLRANINELIVYETDQASNRFKIESNINNYYGLYNDANEMAEPWTSPDASVTNESKDGFTVTNPASGDYVAFELAVPAPHLVPSRIRVSFIADDPDDALNNISCRTSANGLSGSTLTINNGFNSIDINNNVGTGNTTTHINIQFNAGTKTATLSNFKVSRIARNGFVETWYDQSGNDNDAVQATATEQPSVVKNGGIVKLNGKPSVSFDGVDNYFTFTSNFNFNLAPTSVSRPVNTIMFVGENTAGSRSFLGDEGSTKNWIAAPYNGTYQFRDNGSTIYDTTVSATLGSQLVLSIQCPSEDNFSIRENGSAKTLGGTNNISAAIGIRDIGVGYTLSGTPNYQTMKAQEFYFHNERLPNDIVDIENDAINYYNIS